jgi:hypothetical protein
MNKRLKTIADVIEFLEDKVSKSESTVAKMNAETEAGMLHEFLRNDAIDLIVGAHHAKEAKTYLKSFANPDALKSFTDEDKYNEVCGSVRNWIVSHASSQFSDYGRSTSVSANMAKDALKEFYIEFFQRLNDGY